MNYQKNIINYYDINYWDSKNIWWYFLCKISVTNYICLYLLLLVMLSENPDYEVSLML